MSAPDRSPSATQPMTALASMELRALATLLDTISQFDGGASEGDHVSVVMERAVVRIDQTGQHVTIGWDDGNWCLLGVDDPEHGGREAHDGQ